MDIKLLRIMKKIFFIINLALLTSFFAQCQKKYQIEAIIKDIPDNEKVVLQKYQFDKNIPLDTVHAYNNTVSFSLHENAIPGMYKITFSKDKFIDFIFNKEDISIQSHYNSPYDSLKIIQSEENRVFYEYIKIRNQQEHKLDILYPALQQYPKTDNFYEEIVKEFKSTQEEYYVMSNDLIDDKNAGFAAKFIRSDRTPMLEPKLNPKEQKKKKKNHFLDNVDFNDTLLLNSDLFPTKIIGYLSFYQNKSYTKEQMADEFIKASDIIMMKASVNDKVYEYAVSYLIDGFEKFGFEKVITHIAEKNYLENTCINQERKSELQKKLDKIKKMAIGKIAPDVTIPDKDGNKITLSEIKNDFVLVVFWASWCPHCADMLKELKDFYEKMQPDIEILAVSIDHNKQEWVQAIEKNNYQWINVSEVKGWNGKSVDQYNVVGTPTMFLLDSNRKILAKPLNMKELFKAWMKANR